MEREMPKANDIAGLAKTITASGGVTRIYGVERKPGETDQAFAQRANEAIKAAQAKRWVATKAAQ